MADPPPQSHEVGQLFSMSPFLLRLMPRRLNDDFRVVQSMNTAKRMLALDTLSMLVFVLAAVVAENPLGQANCLSHALTGAVRLPLSLYATLAARRGFEAFAANYGVLAVRLTCLCHILLDCPIQMYYTFVNGSSTVPVCVLVLAGGASFSGIPWYYHVISSGVYMAIYVAIVIVTDGALETVAVQHIGEAAIVLLVLGYTSFAADKSRRTEFMVAQRLKLFESTQRRVESLDGNTGKVMDGAESEPEGAFHPVEKTADVPAFVDVVSHLQKILLRSRRSDTELRERQQQGSFFLAAMSHELRSPLTGILGSADLILAEPHNAKVVRGLGEVVHSCGTHLLRVVNDILEYSQLRRQRGRGSIPVVRLNPVVFSPLMMVEDAVTMFMPKALAKDIVLSYSCSSVQHEAVFGDETRVRSVLASFLSNALKFTDHGGQVRVDVSSFTSDSPTIADGCEVLHNQSPSVDVDARAQGSFDSSSNLPRSHQQSNASVNESKESKTGTWMQSSGCNRDRGVILKIVVSDTGIGIDPAQVESMLTPFTQGETGMRRQYGGTGLGLAIASQIANIMGGDGIKVQSTPGRGSTFSVQLKLQSASANRNELSNSRALPTGRGFCDEEARRKHLLLTHLLNRWGFNSKSIPTSPGEEIEGKHHKTSEKGSVFAVDLSVADEGESTKPPSPKRPLKGLRILHVDDVGSLRMLAKRMLTRAGADAHLASDGKIAVDMVTDATGTKKPFDCVFMDLHMPQMDGATATKHIRDALGDAAPVIVGITADKIEEARLRFFEAGASAVIAKPFREGDLVAAALRCTQEELR